jgi:uroporphyrinogen decarboxylase
MIDVQFVRFTPSKEEKKLGRVAQPHEGDTRLGSISQVTTYARWNYHPEDLENRNPLARARSIEDLRAFPFPDVSKPYKVKDLSRQVDDLHARGLAAGGNPPHLGGEMFEAAWRLRGLENFLVDLIKRPDWAHFLLDRLAEHTRRNVEALARAGIDVLALDDDVGMPGSMMMSPDTWRTFFKPRLAEVISSARAIHPELRVLYHSDGWFEPIVGDLIEIGIDAINPLQPDHMDPMRIREQFGTEIVLWGTVGGQTTFSFASPEEIQREVRERIETLGPIGLVLCPAYDIDEPDIPWENIEAFVEAGERFGRT